MSQHAYLPTVMSIVDDHVSNHGDSRGPRSGPPVAEEFFDSSLRRVQRLFEQLRAAPCAFSQRSSRLTLRAACAIEFSGQLNMRRGEPQPLAPDIMHMSEDRRDGARITTGRLRPPGAGIQVLEDELIHPLINGVVFQQRLTKIVSRAARSAPSTRPS